MQKKPYLVGISGGSASGKTHFLDSLKKRFNTDELCIVSQDNYYKLAFNHTRDENGHINFDLPDCVALEDFAADMAALHRGETIQRHEYRFQHEDQRGPLLTFKPAPIIVCEGLFIFYHSSLFDQFDLKVFINADEDIALQRRLKRDVAERNINEDFILYQWKHHVMPSYRQFLLPFMAKADIIVNNNTHFDNSLKMVTAYLEKLVQPKPGTNA
ncbi:MAG: uridine kinase [Bacteroidia bacterium]|nr:uridine kinase [Bacteroidia bacterium]